MNEHLVQRLGEALRARGWRLVTAESCTGGLLAAACTSIAGSSDWGIRQTPGALEKMQTSACTRMRDIHLIDGAGHWVQQEQPEEVTRRLLAFLDQVGSRSLAAN